MVGTDATLGAATGRAYAVDVTEGQATFDLQFEVAGRYRLIVANADWQNVESSVLNRAIRWHAGHRVFESGVCTVVLRH